jgi:hypothetical protein
MADDPERRDPKSPDPGEPTGPGEQRRSGALEGMFQEIVRRAATLGFSSLFLTEEAIRNALSDTVPQEWAEYLSGQSSTVRTELIDRVAAEVGAWLRQSDPEELARRIVQAMLEEYEFTLKIDVTARPRKGAGPALRVLTRSE